MDSYIDTLKGRQVWTNYPFDNPELGYYESIPVTFLSYDGNKYASVKLADGRVKEIKAGYLFLDKDLSQSLPKELTMPIDIKTLEEILKQNRGQYILLGHTITGYFTAKLFSCRNEDNLQRPSVVAGNPFQDASSDKRGILFALASLNHEAKQDIIKEIEEKEKELAKIKQQLVHGDTMPSAAFLNQESLPSSSNSLPTCEDYLNLDKIDEWDEINYVTDLIDYHRLIFDRFAYEFNIADDLQEGEGIDSWGNRQFNIWKNCRDKIIRYNYMQEYVEVETDDHQETGVIWERVAQG